MAFGFPAYHTEALDQIGSGAGVRSAVKKAIRSLGWSIREESSDAITASISINWWSWGERVVVRFLPGGGLSVTSKCALPTQCFDFDKNKANVKELLVAIKKSAEQD
jgi:hypothetical protein